MTLERLFARAVRTPNGCLVIPGDIPSRYAKVAHNGVTTNASRFVYQQHHGVTLPRSTVVCHTCDNPRCVAIEHLYQGTQGDNRRECVAKGRNLSVEKRIESAMNEFWSIRPPEDVRELVANAIRCEGGDKVRWIVDSLRTALAKYRNTPRA